MKRILLLVVFTVSQMSAQSSLVAANDAKTTSTTGTQKAVMPVSDTEYVIGPEDVLQINVWKEPDISSTVPVRPDGKISLPLLSDVQAAGLTPLQLSASLADRMKQFITEPRVTVMVTAMNSRRAYVMGLVTRQGAIILISRLTVLQALSAAGGPAPFAKTKKIYVLRAEGNKQQRIPFNYDEVIKGKNPEQNIVLKPGDTIVVP